MVPSSWEDLTYNQYIGLINTKGDFIDVISLFTGVSRETLSKSDIIGLESVVSSLQFINTTPVIPKSVKQIGKYKLPLDSKGEFNIQYKRLDQFEDMRKSMPKDNTLKSLMDSYTIFVAIYLQPLRDGEYQFTKAAAMVDDVKQMPALEVLSMGAFFLIKQLSLLTGMQKTSRPTNPKPKKLKRALTTSKRSSGRTQRSTGSRGR